NSFTVVGNATFTAGGSLSIVDANAVNLTVSATGTLALNAQGDLNLNGAFQADEIRSQVMGDSTVQGTLTATSNNTAAINLFSVGTYNSGAQYNTPNGGIRIQGVAGVGLFDGSGASTINSAGDVQI